MKYSAIALLFVGTIAFSGEKNSENILNQGRAPSGLCTMDLNEWGQSGFCACNSDESYDDRSGLCMISDHIPEKIITQGTLQKGTDQSDFFSLKTWAGKSYRLILKSEAQNQIEQLANLPFEAIGELIGFPDRDQYVPAIIVEELNILE